MNTLKKYSFVLAIAAVACSSGAGNGGPGTGGGGGFGNFGNTGGTGAQGATTGSGGSGATGAQGGGSGSGAEGGTGPSCAPGMPSGFSASPTQLMLPAPRCGVSFDALGKASGALEYNLADLNGDGFVDLFVHQDDCDAAVGSTHWDLYSGSAAGLAQTPTSFGLPAARCGVSFDKPARSSGALEYGLLDLTGDHLVDLVVVQDDCDTTIGATHWDVYPGSASGFAAAPSSFALPAARCGVAWDDLTKASGALEYLVMDLSGDGTVDLVVHQDDCDLTVGQSHWDVYAGSASGFAAAPASFGLPAARCGVSWEEPTRSSGALEYTLMDVSGDGLSDLVVVQDDCDASVGQTHWDAYAGSPTGFSVAPSAFSLPAPRCAVNWDDPAKLSGAVRYSLLDASCDGFLDLIVTRDDCDASVGQSRWDVYAGSATGIGGTPSPLTLPAARCATAFDAPAKASGSVYFNTMAWNPTDHVSLLVTRDDCDTQIGASHWDYYVAQ
ncbi:MAG: hypothetical protein R3B13_10200 [Polyangiaceae bacterium]